MVDILGLDIGLDEGVAVTFEVEATEYVEVGDGVGVGVLDEQGPVIVTSIQLISVAARVCWTLTVPCCAEHEA